MHFGFTQAERELFERMKALGARVEKAPHQDRLEMLAQAGVLGLSIPEEYGGGGFRLVATAGAYEALGTSLFDGGVLLAAGAHLFGVAMMIAKLGTVEQKTLLLPDLANGKVIATVAATEEESGSDVSGARAAAETTDNGFVITGNKRYVTAAARARLFFTIARNGQSGRGLSAFVVPRNANGITVGEPLRVMGLHNAELAPVSFYETRVDKSALIGKAGAGIAAFQVAMTYERALILAFRLGAMAEELKRSIHFVRTRRLGDTPIAKHQAVAHRVARMKMTLETSRLMTYRAAWALDQGQRAQEEAALAKWHVAESATAFMLDAIKLRGGKAFLEEGGLVQTLNDTVGGSFHSGTEEVLANIVAAWLGL
ncbi:MAG: acyl-CoA/acyl-ACP dehydrogenase [Polyangiaceae bacterium]|nr:acyl-CoA/acyl-ACP dehydrogenase [Polyangiaceae bacterium]